MRCSSLVSQIYLMRYLILLIGFMVASMSSTADTSQLQAVRCDVLGARSLDWVNRYAREFKNLDEVNLISVVVHYK